MDKLVICTTGTSIGSNCGVDRDLLFGKVLGWDDVSPQIQQQLDSCLIEKDLQDVATRRALSAELKSLDLLGLGSRDRVVLLVTDTYQGRVCAETVKTILIDAYGLAENQVELHRVEGLQVNDAERLRKQGLKNMIKIILEKYLDDGANYRYTHNIIFNPTGGFKGIVPFLTVLGMLYGKKTIYVFENSDELIELPPLPFSFDLKIYERVKSALQYIEENVAVSEQEYLGKIKGYTSEEHELFMAFTEPFDDNTITLSPLAYCLLPRAQEKSLPLISNKVAKTLEKCRGYSGDVLREMILNSTDSLWRQQHYHKWGKTTDLTIMKASRRQERLAGFMRNNQFHVALAYSDHDDYARELSNYKVKDFENEDFNPWEPDKKIELDRDLSDCQKRTDKLSEKIDRLSEENQNFDESVKLAEEEALDLSTQLSVCHQDIEIKSENLAQLGEELQSSHAQIDTLKAQLQTHENKGILDCIKSFFKAS